MGLDHAHAASATSASRCGFAPQPGLRLIAISTLALGIGANTAIFSVVDHVLLRPLPYRDSDRLYAVHEVVPKFAYVAPLVPVNAMHFREWRRNVRSFDQMALIGGTPLNLTGTGEPERLAAARVSPALFTMLGVRPQIGRTFVESEDHPGRDAVVVIDDALWKRRFAADRGILGRKIVLDGRPYEVIGVLPPDFRFPKLASLYAMTLAEARPQIWKPFAVKDDELDTMGDFNYACIVSLKPGVSLAHAAGELGAAQKTISDTVGEHIELLASMVPLQDQITGRSRTGLNLLLAAVGVVLLIGCVNIANLLLAQAAGRRREIAIRSAIGASGARLVRQMLVESLVLSAIGGAGGVLVSYSAVEAIRSWAPVDLPRLDEIRRRRPCAAVRDRVVGRSRPALRPAAGVALCARRAAGGDEVRQPRHDRQRASCPRADAARRERGRVERRVPHRGRAPAPQLRDAPRRG